ncbi:MAG TPA: hypothetical protein VG839_07905 [Asticcacaulis sp.]|nr:hypothetical protein [Asticcacaulis sp.]
MAPPPSTKSELNTFLKDERIVAFINYALLIFILPTFGITGLLAFLSASFCEDKASDWIKSHYEFQKRTFWLAIGPILLTLFVIAFMAHNHINQPYLGSGLILLCLLYMAGRCIMGFNHLLYHRPYPNPKTWTV